MTVSGLLLTHGAGGGADHHVLRALEEQLDLPVRRMEFPYRREGRRAPDRAPKLIEDVISEANDFVRELDADPDTIVVGGRSMGGRICSMAVAEGLPAAGLVLLSYPLHPPGKPERLRVEHFESIGVPTVVVNGDRDPFGTPEEVEREFAAVRGSVTLHWLEGQRHDPKPEHDQRIVELVEQFVTGR